MDYLSPKKFTFVIVFLMPWFQMLNKYKICHSKKGFKKSRGEEKTKKDLNNILSLKGKTESLSKTKFYFFKKTECNDFTVYIK